MFKISIAIKGLMESTNFKNGIIFSLFSALNNGLNFLLIFILSIYLSKSDFGTINLFNTFLLISTTVISLGTQSYFSVAFFKKSNEELTMVLNSIILISLITFSLLTVSLFIISVVLEINIGFIFKYQFLGLLICFFQLIYNLNLEVFRLEEKPIYYGILSILWISLNLLITYYFCVNLSGGWIGRVNAQLIASILIFILNIYLLKKHGYLKRVIPQIIHLKESLHFGIPLIPHTSSVWMRQGIDRYFINFYHTTAMVGSFSFAYNFAGIIMMFGTAFNATNSVYIFKNLGNEFSEEIRLKLLKQTKLMTLLFFIITLISIVSVYFFIKILLPKYNDSVPFIIPLCLMGFLQSVYYLFVNYLFYFNKTKLLMYITFFVSVFHVFISFVITMYSTVYTAYLGLFSGLIICILTIYYSNKLVPLFNYKKI